MRGSRPQAVEGLFTLNAPLGALFVLVCFPEHSTTLRGWMKRPLSFVLLPLFFLWMGGVEMEEGT